MTSGEGFAFFRWTEHWRAWIEADPETVSWLREDWARGVRWI